MPLNTGKGKVKLDPKFIEELREKKDKAGKDGKIITK